jgi:adenylate kinase
VVDAAIYLEASEDELVRRLSARRECPRCKRAYNLISAPSRDGLHCDDHPDVELVRRADDAPETVRKRLDVYREQTEPLIGWYRAHGLLREVPGLGPMDEVYRGLAQALAAVRQAG